MKITFLTMFPEMLVSFQNSPIVLHAIKKNILQVEIIDIRNYAKGSYRHIDDSPYGGGAGMILRYDVLHEALASCKTEDSYVILPIPSGNVYCQSLAHSFSLKKHIILICGHYEGVDARIYEECDALLTIGDYVLSGGEYAGMCIADSIVRLLDGVMKAESTKEESFERDLLEYRQYTKPSVYNESKVPDVLLSGNHELIRQYRKKDALEWTRKYRPDLLKDQQ